MANDKDNLAARQIREFSIGELVDLPEPQINVEEKRAQLEAESELRRSKNANARRLSQVSAQSKILD